MKVNTVCIVGGGSAGWSTALAFLKKMGNIEVTLIESSDIGTIGVGEATQPGVTKFFNEYLGLDEATWIKETDATYKVGSTFTNFNNLEEGDTVNHTFWTHREADHSVYDWGIKKRVIDGVTNRDYSPSLYAAPYMLEDRKFGKRDDTSPWYACHLDASKFAEFAKTESKKLGLTHILDTVIGVNVGDAGITSLELKEGGEVVYDLFIDCTGFSSALIQKALGSNFIDKTSELPNDSAIATRLEYSDKEAELKVHTQCTAISNGWVWEVPLWSRKGTGYVYSSKFVTQEQAETEFLSHLSSKYPDSVINDLELKHLKMRVGYQETPWIKNCVAIGLSSQFLEPLESTGLLFTVYSIQDCISLLQTNNRHLNGLMASRYNDSSTKMFFEAYDFVLLHYMNTQRDDTAYWRHLSSLSPSKNLLDSLYEIEKNGVWKLETSRVFPEISWEHIITGFNILDLSDRLTIEGETLDKERHYDNILATLEYLKNREVSNTMEVLEMHTSYQYLRGNIYG